MKVLRRISVIAVVGLTMLITGFGASNYGEGIEVLKKGDSSEHVRNLQQALKIAGTFKEHETSDYYGNLTESAVKAFQDLNGLENDGVAGSQTYKKIAELNNWSLLHKELYKKGMDDHDIIVLQASLHTLGFYKKDNFSTYFDEVTFEAVKAFQESYGLESDGIVGKATINKLKELKVVMSESNDQEIALKEGTAQVISTNRGVTARYGEYVSWSEVHQLLDVGTTIRIRDFKTGIEFNAMVGHGSNHADIEPLTKEDTAKMKAAWGGTFSWERRPMLVFYKNRVFAASLNGMPHAGKDSEPAMEVVSGRSAGYGRGINYDLVKGNGMDGHICLHFKGSLLHSSNKTDPRHQECVRIAAGKE